MAELKMTHVLLLAVAAFLMYHFISGCNCNRGDGFNVGGQEDSACKCTGTYLSDGVCTFPKSQTYPKGKTYKSSICNEIKDHVKCNQVKDGVSYACDWEDMTNIDLNNANDQRHLDAEENQQNMYTDLRDRLEIIKKKCIPPI